MPYRVTRSQWVNCLSAEAGIFPKMRFNSLWSSDAIWQHKFYSTSVQVIAYCQMAPSHYLNQCWFIIREVQWQSNESNPSTVNFNLKITCQKVDWNLPGAIEFIPCLLLPWIFVSPGHQQPWYQLYIGWTGPCLLYEKFSFIGIKKTLSLSLGLWAPNAVVLMYYVKLKECHLFQGQLIHVLQDTFSLIWSEFRCFDSVLENF